MRNTVVPTSVMFCPVPAAIWRSPLRYTFSDPLWYTELRVKSVLVPLTYPVRFSILLSRRFVAASMVICRPATVVAM